MAKTTRTRKISLGERIRAENDRLGQGLARRFAEAGVFVANLMSSPGAGKTSLLEETARRLAGEFRMAAVNGDLATDHDGVRLRRAGLPTEVINTGGGCHLNARQVAAAVDRFDLAALDILFIENVGNLVCPAGFDLGEHRRVVVASTPEGDDKPAKYPVAFHAADCVVLNKMDSAQAAGFSREAFERYVRALRPDLPILALSCRTGEGLEAWLDWVRRERAAARQGPRRR